MIAGPLIPGTPWWRQRLQKLAVPPNGGRAPTPAAPGAGEGPDKPFLERVPPGPGYEERLARMTNKLVDRLNSLVRKGHLKKTALDEWEINASTVGDDGGGLTGTFDSPGTYP